MRREGRAGTVSWREPGRVRTVIGSSQTRKQGQIRLPYSNPPSGIRTQRRVSSGHHRLFARTHAHASDTSCIPRVPPEKVNTTKVYPDYLRASLYASPGGQQRMVYGSVLYSK